MKVNLKNLHKFESERNFAYKSNHKSLEISPEFVIGHVFARPKDPQDHLSESQRGSLETFLFAALRHKATHEVVNRETSFLWARPQWNSY